MTQLTPFPRYSQKENWATNHTLLLMRRLYEFNPSKFRRFLQELDDESADIASHLGVFFAQQIGERRSIPDGVFMQESVKVIVETKTDTSFSHDQIRRHLNGLKEEKHGLLILLSPTVEQIPNMKLTPDDKPLLPTEEMKSVVEDFEAFCSEEGLLPRDDFTLMMVPCGRSFKVNMDNHLYYCPTSYTHSRNARYLGIYTEKSIHGIGEIKKCVECTVDLKAKRVIADGLTPVEEQRILKAVPAARDVGQTIENGHKFYICDKIVPTDFRKTSAYGIQGHRYLDLRTYLGDGDLPTVEEIANQLKNKSWD